MGLFGKNADHARPPVDLGTALTDGVVRQVRTTVVLAPSQDVLVGQLAGVNDEELLVRLFESAPRLPGGQVCAVTFCHDGRSVAFLARLLEHTGIALRFRRPKQGMVYQGRQHFRVPVVATSGMTVRVVTEHGSLDGVPLDISLGGLGVQFGEPPPWPIDTEVVVHLKREGLEAKVFARVVWCRKNIYGFVFSGLRRSEYVGELTRLVCDLEREWMQD